MILPQTFYLQNTLTVARDLLGKTLVRTTNGHRLSGMVVETEAYLDDDAACHASRGVTPRNRPMFEAGGISYVYFIYGMHHCFNVVTGPPGQGSAVLIRALEPQTGLDEMKKMRQLEKKKNLTNGPGKLAQAFGITKSDNGIPLYQDSAIHIRDTDFRPGEIVTTTRIGIKLDRHLPYRFYLKDNPWVSVP